MAQAGISTLGILFGYGLETLNGGTGVADAPTTYKLLNRINSIGGVNLSTETIDSSALEDMITRTIAGRQDTGGSFTVTVNVTDETIAEWSALIAAYNGLTDGLRMWFEVWSPYLTDAFYIVAQPPKILPMPESGQNALWTMELTLTIEEYIGLDTAIKPVA